MNLIIQLLLVLICYTYSKSIYLERGILLNLFFINPKNKYKNNENLTLLTISLAEIININNYNFLGIGGNNLLGIGWNYLYWYLLCISIINRYNKSTFIIYCIFLLFPLPVIYLYYVHTIIYIRNIILLLIKKKYYRLMLIFIKSIFNVDIMINRLFHKKEVGFLSWIYEHIPFYNYNEVYKYVNIYTYNNIHNEYIYNFNSYSDKIIININNFINEKIMIEAIILLRIMFLFYYNYYVYKLDL
jgi:hypothetical protein